MGRAKEFLRTSALGRKKKVSPPFPSRAQKSLCLSLSKAYYAGQGKESERLGTLSERVVAKTLREHVKLEYERLTSQLHSGEMKRFNQVTHIYKSLRFIAYSVVFLLSCYF